MTGSMADLRRMVRTTDLVQRLQVARRELALESAIAELDRDDLLILDDITYVTKDQAETSVLFELIATRYERRLCGADGGGRPELATAADSDRYSTRCAAVRPRRVGAGHAARGEAGLADDPP